MKIHADVLPVLSVAVIDGNAVRLTGQLDRKLYERTNKVLEALGGLWNRKAKAHLFEVDPAAAIENALLTGEVTTAQDLGFFPTPEPLATKLCTMAKVTAGDRCLEPSCGDGNIVLAMLAAGAKHVTAVEYDNGRRLKMLDRFVNSPYADGALVSASCRDFMEFEDDGMDATFVGATIATRRGFDRVVMNPAFLKVGLGDHLDHVQRAYSMLRKGGRLVSVLPNGIVFRQDRRHRAFSDWYQSLGGVVEELPPGSFKDAGTGVNTVTLTIDAR